MGDALRLTYADIKTVKTRGVYQLVLEGPIEGMQDAMRLLGAPVPGNEVWCAVARLKDSSSVAEKEPAPKKGTLAQQAGILCNEPAFRRFLAEKDPDSGIAMLDGDMAARDVRQICGVSSRSELDRNELAGRRFRDLKADYELWLKDVAAA